MKFPSNIDVLFPAARSQRFMTRESGEALATPAAGTSLLGPVDEKKMTAPFLISTPRRDRQGDVVIPEGCKASLDVYAANPVVFFCHATSDMPIALARDGRGGDFSVWFDERGICSTAWFHGETAESEEVFRAVAAGILKGASIGFIPRKAERITGRFDPEAEGEMDLDFGGLIFTAWDLHEWSVVPVPANPEAVRSALDRWVKTDLLAKALTPFAASANRAQVYAGGKRVKDLDDLIGPPGSPSSGDKPPATDAPKPPVYRDDRHPSGESPQCAYFDAAVFPDEAACRAWLDANGLKSDGAYSELSSADLVPPGVTPPPADPSVVNPDVAWRNIELFPASTCEPGTMRVEDLEMGVKAVFCKPTASPPATTPSPTDTAPDGGKSLMDVNANETLVQAAKVKADDGMQDRPQPKMDDRPEEAAVAGASDKQDVMPFGAEVLHGVLERLGEACAYVEEMSPRMEQPKLAKFLAKLCGNVGKLCAKATGLGASLYPDHFDGKAGEEEEEGEEEGIHIDIDSHNGGKADDEDYEKRLADPALAVGLHALLGSLLGDARLTAVERGVVRSFAARLRGEKAAAFDLAAPAAPAAPAVDAAAKQKADEDEARRRRLQAELDDVRARYFRLTGEEV